MEPVKKNKDEEKMKLFILLLFVTLVEMGRSEARVVGNYLCLSTDLCHKSVSVINYLQFVDATVSARCADAERVYSNASYGFDLRSFARTCYMSSTGERSILFSELND